ncbi:MAG TPA: ATP-grasp domain-containing protein [Candidatus Paceibacterota bacterium]|nr:ATP-grasp domain-containing protein [Candidatus Paceibacterota bacterium]
MTKKPRKARKNVILIIGLPNDLHVVKRILAFGKHRKQKYRFAVMMPQNKTLLDEEKEVLHLFDIVLTCNFDSPESIMECLAPYQDGFVAVTARGEQNIPHLKKVIPYLPYLRTPTQDSLEWATSKIEMRRRFTAYDKKITPSYMVVSDTSKKTIKAIVEKIGTPLVIKPSGLAVSLLVTIAFHQEELEKSLRKVFRHLRVQYKKNGGRGEPQVLVEQFMEGDMYSIDIYVDSRGKMYFCPLVHIKTGRTIGFDDFFGYQQMTPTLLAKESIAEAQEASKKAIHALGLRSTTVHLELMKTEQGWKIIELGPRIGGFRDMLYELAYGIKHTENDIAVRIPERPKLPRKLKGYAAALKIFARQEGVITNFLGVKKVQALESLHSMETNKKIGDRAVFAKNGGKSVFDILLFNKDRSRLLADIRRIEQALKIETKASSRS